MSSSLSVVHVLAVFVGSGVGGVVRYLLQRGGVVVFGADRPWATLLINVAGSLLIGALFGWFSTRPQLEAHKLFALTGVLVITSSGWHPRLQASLFLAGSC